MPTTNTTILPVPKVIQWRGLGDLNREISVVPRAEIRFQVAGADLPVPTAGEDGFLIISCPCPPNFAYTFGELHMKILGIATETVTWDNVGELTLASNTSGALADFLAISEVISTGNHGGLIQIGQAKVYGVNQPCAVTVIPDTGSAVTVSITLGNATTDYEADTLDFFMRLFMYDIEQANHYQVNTPTLIRQV